MSGLATVRRPAQSVSGRDVRVVRRASMRKRRQARATRRVMTMSLRRSVLSAGQAHASRAPNADCPADHPSTDWGRSGRQSQRGCRPWAGARSSKPPSAWVRWGAAHERGHHVLDGDTGVSVVRALDEPLLHLPRVLLRPAVEVTLCCPYPTSSEYSTYQMHLYTAGAECSSHMPDGSVVRQRTPKLAGDAACLPQRFAVWTGSITATSTEPSDQAW